MDSFAAPACHPLSRRTPNESGIDSFGHARSKRVHSRLDPLPIWLPSFDLRLRRLESVMLPTVESCARAKFANDGGTLGHENMSA
ncbi:hypothetical protein GGU11DRAFT_750581 [Lentinula aff. detonsa]|nr:hypothetical protein GGU11DRAFT_750581 [Lentinula aff. detonsa]